MTNLIKTNRQGPTATITLNRPDTYNALNEDMREQLAQAIRQVEADPSIRVVTLAGEGRGFCAGADLKTPSDKRSGAVLEEEFHPCLAPIWNSEKIYIAAVGNNYTEPNLMRSELLIATSDKICLNDYEEAYKANPTLVINELTKFRIELIIFEILAGNL